MCEMSRELLKQKVINVRMKYNVFMAFSSGWDRKREMMLEGSRLGSMLKVESQHLLAVAEGKL